MSRYNGYEVEPYRRDVDRDLGRRSRYDDEDRDLGRRSRYDDDYDGPGRSVGAGNKRLIVACDGTWQDSNASLDDGKVDPPTNVTRICRAIKALSASGIPQIVYYQAGPGSSSNPLDKVIGGAVGAGVNSNIREAFSFLSNNYTPGDEIFLVGFSRGAYTARMIGSMIATIGILTKKGLEDFAVINKDFQHRYDKHYRSPQPNTPFPNKPSLSDPEYVDELYRRGLTIPDVSIKAIGVWDTVGALGVPRFPLLQKWGLGSKKMDEIAFYDTTVDQNVENAFQILALDEKRSAFPPTLWELPKGSRTVLKQTWMPGVHSNVGGSYEDANLANVSLAWMISNLSSFLDFDDDYILEEFDKNVKYYRKTKQKVRQWALGKLYDSNDGLFALGGSTTRTPGQYFRRDPITCEETRRPLRSTNETIHISTRTRIDLKGKGEDDEGYYNPKALKSWKCRWDDEARGYKWIHRRTGQELYEEPLGDVERKLLECSPDVYDYVYDMGADDGGGKYVEDDRRDPVYEITDELGRKL